MAYTILNNDCTVELERLEREIHLTFLDPPFNQGKDYNGHDDNLPDDVYWEWMKKICKDIYKITARGGAIYFMQREKNTEFVLKSLRESGWYLQNLIVWKKKTSAVPCSNKFGKNYQIIAFAIKGDKP
ncbi:MAG: DNA methyltransferase, partial [Thermodesulfovibrionales bacterium]|nr:DNA methyltransferase [Thermodesulfovibrionales bacterium]